MLTLDNEQIKELLEQGVSEPFFVQALATRPIVTYEVTAVIKHSITGKLYSATFIRTSNEVDFTEVEEVPSVTYEPLDNKE